MDCRATLLPGHWDFIALSRELRASVTLVALLAIALVTSGCSSNAPDKNARQDDGANKPAVVNAAPQRNAADVSKALAEFNRGAALLEQYRYAEAAKAFETALKLAPDWESARFNLGLAVLNMEGLEDKGSRYEDAHQAFVAVLKQNPEHLPARFCLGLYHQQLGEHAPALECFEAVFKRDPHDPYVAFKCGEMLSLLGRNDEAMKKFEIALADDPGFVSAAYRLAQEYQRTNQTQKAEQLFDRFRQLSAAELFGGTVGVQKVYGMAGKYYLALGADDLPLKSTETTSARRIVFSPKVRPLPTPTAAWKWSGGAVALPGLAAGDLAGRGRLDLCIAGLGDKGETVIWQNDGRGQFTAGKPIAGHGVSPCLGDVGNAGRVDIWLGTATGSMLLQNDGQGNFKRGESPGLAADDGFAVCTRLLDIDSDGDLDLLAFRLKSGSVPADGLAIPAKCSVYQNNRDGTFLDIAAQLGFELADVPVAAVVCDDFDNDGDPDLMIFPADGQPPRAWVNDRAGKFHWLDAAALGLKVDHVISASSGDPNKDGKRDLLIFAQDGMHLFINRGDFHFEEQRDFRERFGRLGGTSGQFADLANEGKLDIVIADAHRKNGSRGPVLLRNDWPRDRFVDAAEADPGMVIGEISFPGDASCIVADFCGKGRCDILLAPIGEAPRLVENITPGGHWIELDLSGARRQDNKARSNTSAVGARVELRSGGIYEQYVVGGTAGGVADSPLRIHAGLGENERVEWLRIRWPDGVLQAEVDLPADRVTKIEETPRKTSSCPNVFAWDGTHFQFVSDFAGVGGLGYLVSPGEYAPPRSTEYVRLPHLEPLAGEYVLQVMEPLEEIVYLDEVKLIAVDHPLGTEVFPNELMAVNAPSPAYEVFCVRQPIHPVRAIDHRGVDVTEALRHVDRRYAGATDPDPRFMGFAKEHFVELDFGDRLQSLPADARLVLFLQGWVEYGYSSTDYAAAQAGLRLKAPSIHAERDGRWVELFHEAGYPAGLNHSMTLDVTGKVLRSDRKLRVSSNMELYWDQIYLAAPLPKSAISERQSPVRSADLHYLGYPREYSPDGRDPNLYDYNNIDKSLLWKSMAGDYTRFGDVTELLAEADDCYVIMGPGEEVTLRFPAAAFGPVPAGMTRTFLLKADAYCKDMDPYTAFPDTVAPLPFHAMSGYPYSATEHYPDTEKTRAYRQRFNTRQIRGTY